MAVTQRTRATTNHTLRQMAFAITAAAALATAHVATAQPRLTGGDIERIARSVVRIDALRNGEVVRTGSGTIVLPTGQIVTNRHVIENSDDWEIAMLHDIDERPVPRYRASLRGYSLEVDIAVLEIDRWADGKPLVSENLDLPSAVWAEWDLQRGDYVGLLGYPGIGGGFLTFTEGGIATVRRGSVGGETASVAYQTDAEIAPGNSGGLAVNRNGEMVGIPSAAATEATGGRLAVIITLEALLKAVNAGLETDRRNTNRSFVDAFAEANYGTLLVQAGRRPEGHRAAGIAGGSMDVAEVIDECRGWISTTPDYRVRWTGRAESLGFRFGATESAAGTDDTTLTVRTPDGRWFCDDDSAGGMDPMIIIDDPEPGDYTVWAGSYVQDAFIEGELLVLDSASLPPEETARTYAAPVDAAAPGGGDYDVNYGPWQTALSQGARVCVLGVGRQAVGASRYVAEALQEAERFVVQRSCGQQTDIVFTLMNGDDVNDTVWLPLNSTLVPIDRTRSSFVLTATANGANQPFWAEAMIVRWRARGAALDLGKAFNAWAEQWGPVPMKRSPGGRGSQRLAILEYARQHDFRIDDFIDALGKITNPRSRSGRRRHLRPFQDSDLPSDRGGGCRDARPPRPRQRDCEAPRRRPPYGRQGSALVPLAVTAGWLVAEAVDRNALRCRWTGPRLFGLPRPGPGLLSGDVVPVCYHCTVARPRTRSSVPPFCSCRWKIGLSRRSASTPSCRFSGSCSSICMPYPIR